MAVGDVLWSPPDDIRRRSRIGHFLDWLAAERGRRFADYPALWSWSTTDLAGFWGAIWDYFEVVGHAAPVAVLSGRQMPGTRWFPGATLNYAENVLRMPGLAADDPVVLGLSQTREPVTLTAAELREQVRRVRAGLRRLGVRRGDRVAAYLPNLPEAVVLLLASASLGAVFSSCPPEFGVRAATDRWRQIGPAVLVAVDGYRYGDTVVDRRAEVAAIRSALPSLRHTVSLSYLDASTPDGWSRLAADTAQPLEFTPVPAGHPLYVLYSSGTTGLPKPIVHGHGGILVEHLKMLALHHDLGPGDRFFWFTTTGWMMWNYLVSGPAVGSAIVLFDGDPTVDAGPGRPATPDPGVLWRLAGTAGVSYFGTSAPYLMACRRAGVVPRDLVGGGLRGVGSTGAPLPPAGFSWVYDAVGDDVLLSSLSGGTDLCTGFLAGCPLLPVTEGEIACRALGARIAAYDPAGRPVVDRLGELVVTAPMPSMPVGFWGDRTGERYRRAYFEMYPGVWRHGDWITITSRGTCVVAGRSDATLNRGGVRLGTAEFYAVVEDLPEVVDSLVVHLPAGVDRGNGGIGGGGGGGGRGDDPGGGGGEDGGQGRLLLFVVLAGGAELDAGLRARITRELRTALSPRHVPDEIHQVPAVPRTLSGKKLEIPVKKLLMGTPVTEVAAAGALANPESLAAFASLDISRDAVSRRRG